MTTTTPKTSTRPLGSLTSADLGIRIKEPPLPADSPMRRNHRQAVGTLVSVHHFEVVGEKFTAAIVRVVRSETQTRKKEPDHREIRGPASLEVETHG